MDALAFLLLLLLHQISAVCLFHEDFSISFKSSYYTTLAQFIVVSVSFALLCSQHFLFDSGPNESGLTEKLIYSRIPQFDF